MDFTIPDELLALKERTERFVRQEILPYENDPRQRRTGRPRICAANLSGSAAGPGFCQSACRAREWGGLGSIIAAKAVVFEAAGYSPLAPIALNSLRPTKPTCTSSTVAASGRRNNGCGPRRRRDSLLL